MSDASKSKAPARLVHRRLLAHPSVLFHPEPVFVQDSVGDAYGTGRAIVVVISRVLPLDPANEPHVDVRVAIELLVEAGVSVVANEWSPEAIRCDELRGQLGHRRAIEIRVSSNALTKPRSEIAVSVAHVSRRDGVSDWRTCITASPNPRTASRVGRGSTTGMSLP